jgi:D-alanyl-D-alanine carboxypeptidase/D-alanyl-D-alanine-endopeptidase (penicillin-binding protein 4)
MSPRAHRSLLALASLLTVVVLGYLVLGGGDSSSGDSSDGDAAQAPVGAQAPVATADLATPVLSARRAPELVRAGIADDRILAALEPVLAEAPADSCVVVTSAGRTVVSTRAEEPVVPASTQKLMVAAAALATFGDDHRLSTVAAAAEAPEGGVVDGDLYLVGGGDPLLTTPGYQVTFENPAQLANDFAQLADGIAASGVREVRGGVVGDESRYDTERWIPTWPERYQREGYVGPLSALMVNDGSTGFATTPGAGTGPRVAGDPPSLAAETLITLLEERGVEVAGGASSGRAPEGAVEVAALPSLPMVELVEEMLSDSDNTTAELLVKELGLHASGQGTTTAGLQAVLEALAAEGLPVDGLDLLDGSGLDPANQATCGLLVESLDRLGRDSVVGRSLPVAGETGTLRWRMGDTPADGRVQAKTGTLAQVNALAGFASTEAGGQLTFAYVINGPEQPRGYAPIDELAAALVAVPDGPAVELLGPRPVTPRP